MKEIKSVRVRKKYSNDEGALDLRVVLFEKTFGGRSAKAVEANVSGFDPDKMKAIWPEIEYNGSRYKDYTDDQILDEYITLNSKLIINQSGVSSKEKLYDIIQDPWTEKPPVFRSFGFDPYYLNNGSEIYVKWLQKGKSFWENTGATGSGVTEMGLVMGVTSGTIPDVISINRNSEPEGNPFNGERYILGDSPSGPNWSSITPGSIVEWTASEAKWIVSSPEIGMTVKTIDYLVINNTFFPEERLYKYKEGDLLVTGGAKWSNDYGQEVDVPRGTSFSFKIVGGYPVADTSNSEKNYYIKTIESLNQKTGESLMLSDNGLIKYDLDADVTKFPGNVKDLDIIDQFISKWKNKIPNYDLKLCDPNNQKCEVIEYKSPLYTSVENKQGDILAVNESEKPKLTLKLPDEFDVKHREDVPKFSIWFGTPLSDTVEQFDFGADELLVSDEYVESGFVGSEEAPEDLPEAKSSTVDDEGSNNVNPIIKSPGGGGVKLPTGKSAYSHNSTQGYNLVDSQWYGDLLTSALAHIDHPTFDIPGTDSGALGCASWVSMVFYRAFGVNMKDGKPVKAIPKKIGDFGNEGTGTLGGWFGQNPNMWEKIPWKEGQPGDVINTERGSKAGHVGIVMDSLNKDGSYNVASNSSKGFGSSGDPQGCGKLNYSIKKWQSVTDRNPSKTFCWRYKGPKLTPGQNT